MIYQGADLNDLLRTNAMFNSERAYKQLFAALFPAIKNFANTFLKSTELAEEVASDVMITIWRKRIDLCEVQNLKVYALVIAKNLSLNILKQQAKHQFITIDDINIELTLPEQSPEQILIYEELKRKVEKAIESLPNKCKLVYKLVKEEGFSYKETGEILSISSKTVDAHLVSAVTKITSALKLEFNLSKY